MRRRQLVEIEDLVWCPRAVRNGATEWLGFMMTMTAVFSRVVPKIRAAMDSTRTNTVLDLCSGSGGPWLMLDRELARAAPAEIILSDLYPNSEALEEIHLRSDGRLRYYAQSLDATDVPATIDGVRTMFNAFHHFPPAAAMAILADAVHRQRAIAVFEGINHRAVGLFAIPLQLPAILLLTPLLRPFRWSRLLFTYVIPLIPIVVLWDGTVSVLRVYLPDEMRALVARVPGHDQFVWDIGSLPIVGRFGISYLVGIPNVRMDPPHVLPRE
jgi:hypothetical protein